MDYTSRLTIFPEESDTNLKIPSIKKAIRFVTIKTVLIPIEGNGKVYQLLHIGSLLFNSEVVTVEYPLEHPIANKMTNILSDQIQETLFDVEVASNVLVIPKRLAPHPAGA